MKHDSSLSLPELVGSPRRPWHTGGEVSLHIQAEPVRLYDLVADVCSASTRSEEVQKCVWLPGSPAGAMGSRFRGYNRSGLARWSRVCEVIAATPGVEFVFRTVPERFDPLRRDSTLWRYRFQAEGAGTLVTHGYSLVNPPAPWLMALYGVLLPQHRDVRPALRHTLERLKSTAEGA